MAAIGLTKAIRWIEGGEKYFDERSSGKPRKETRNGRDRVRDGNDKDEPKDSVEKTMRGDKDERPRTREMKMGDESMKRKEMKSEIKVETELRKTGRRWMEMKKNKTNQ